ncbi:MAG: hypothetical protein HC841_04080, partial [Verrucomicrobiae bacterium]|nr:hypothetical protein [Verrucomicrobiae bacterium]
MDDDTGCLQRRDSFGRTDRYRLDVEPREPVEGITVRAHNVHPPPVNLVDRQAAVHRHGGQRLDLVETTRTPRQFVDALNRRQRAVTVKRHSAKSQMLTRHEVSPGRRRMADMSLPSR